MATALVNGSKMEEVRFIDYLVGNPVSPPRKTFDAKIVQSMLVELRKIAIDHNILVIMPHRFEPRRKSYEAYAMQIEDAFGDKFDHMIALHSLHTSAYDHSCILCAYIRILRAAQSMRTIEGKVFIQTSTGERVLIRI